MPVKDGSWDVNWLWNQAGWLEGTAFPTWAGNTVITSHVYQSNGLPGPFIDLKKLQYGDKVQIYAWGEVYTYEVRFNYLVKPDNMFPLQSEEYDWLTLFTCEQYDEQFDDYRYRRVIRAILVETR